MANLYITFILIILLLILIYKYLKYINFKYSVITILLLIIIILLTIFGGTLCFGKFYRAKNSIVLNSFISELNSTKLSNKSVELPQQYMSLSNTLKNNYYFGPTNNNSIQILENARVTYDSLFNEMQNAKHHIHIEDFMIRDDYVSKKLQEILINKSKQGIKVRLLVDGFGVKFKDIDIKKMKDAGIDFRIFNSTSKSIITGSLNNRDHRKIFIIDGKVAFTGGINIGDEYLEDQPEKLYWRDTDILIKGDAVKQLQCIFLSSWFLNTKENINGNDYFPETSTIKNQTVQVINGDPNTNMSSVRLLYKSMINSATKSIYITTPYLILDNDMYNTLSSAALRGIDINILIPGIPDGKFTYLASEYYAKKLSTLGIKTYKYTKGFIHSKIIIIDENMSSVGTANFNNRSSYLDYENCIVIYDANISKDLSNSFIEDLKTSQLMEKDEFNNYKFSDYILQKLSILLSPIQ